MDLITLYVLFALTTGFVSVYELWAPVITELEPTNPIKENKWAAYVACFGISTFTAPLVVLPCIIPNWGERFRGSVLKVFKDTKI